ncbi:hypothetical protein BH23GEM3_BH23GEM3_23920 [soil metagenome]|nr:prepilin-type N-terminal cleavage/methylation domain-containing protein [Gemmatimonadota bacterium]
MQCSAGKRVGGFTLIEVLIAMVIMAVGLLALQGLGVMAVRMVGGADKNTRAAATASFYTEDALRQLSRNRTPAPLNCPLPGGGSLSRTVDVSSTLRKVRVEVTPATSWASLQPLVVESSLFNPSALTTGNGSCPP